MAPQQRGSSPCIGQRFGDREGALAEHLSRAFVKALVLADQIPACHVPGVQPRARENVHALRRRQQGVQLLERVVEELRENLADERVASGLRPRVAIAPALRGNERIVVSRLRCPASAPGSFEFIPRSR